MSLYLTNEIHEIIYILYLPFENTENPGTYPANIYRPSIQNNKDLFIDGNLSRAVFHPCQCHGS